MQDVVDSLVGRLPQGLRERVRRGVPMAPHTTLRVGGQADALLRVDTVDELCEVASLAQRTAAPLTLLGGGSNVCLSDAGVRGLVVINAARDRRVGEETEVGTGHGLMSLFRATAAAGLSGLEFAVGIPGTVGGALVSNAGAYRRSIEPLVRSLTVVVEGSVATVGSEWMGFGYRTSRLRRIDQAPAVVASVVLTMAARDRCEILAEARDNQRARISRQPWLPSAGSFFKNVTDPDLAAVVPGLPEQLRANGVVPAGYLSQACDCRGLQVGGAAVSDRHGNFIVNVGGATADDVRTLADEVRDRVRDRFGVTLEEEVLYVGDWSHWTGRQGR